MSSKTYDLSAVHGADLAILKEIDRICRKHKIQYLMDSGTLLGAVRHKGFIPWDDDADVAFTRENYEKFKTVVRDELPEGMEFLEPDQMQGGKAFFDFTPRILYLNSKTHEDGPEMDFYDGKLNHIYVDLFIQDRLPDNKLAAGWTKLVQTVIYGLAMGHRYHLDYSKYSLVNKLCVGALALIGKCIPMNLIWKMQHAVAVKDRNRDTDQYYYSNYAPDYFYVTVRRHWVDQVVDLPFENMKLMAPAGWHQILAWLYGDYMTPPPEDKQVPTHSSMEIEVYEDVSLR